MPRVFVPVQLRDLTGGLAEVAMPGVTVGELVENLEGQFPGMKGRICAGGDLSPALQVSIDGTFSRRGLDARVAENSEVHFLPVFGGG
jgi:molybdopterin converting factor small subunit